METHQITIGQTLHGYSNGHRLLASSVNLSKESHRTVLILSDLSGQNILAGFDQYLTGYNLEKERLYALAKTWYADEMNRPGCVWTHTFFIRHEDLGLIDDIRFICNQYSRPTNSGFQSYNTLLKVRVKHEQNHNPPANPLYKHEKKIAYELIRNLYEKSSDNRDSNLVIEAKSSSKYESLITSMWSQCFGILKKDFSFCTGAIGERTINNKPFKLQVTHSKSVKLFQRSNQNYKFIDEIGADSLISQNQPLWVKVIYDDLVSFSDIGFRHFKNEYLRDLDDQSISLKEISQLYVSLKYNDSCSSTFDDTMKLISELFPLPNQAVSLKLSVTHSKDNTNISSSLDTGNHHEQQNELRILGQLSSTPYFSALPISELRIQQRAKNVISYHNNDLEPLISRLLGDNINPIGELLLKEIALNINFKKLTELSGDIPDVLLTFSSINPKIATNRDFWNMSPWKLSKIIDNFSSSDSLQKNDISKIVVNVLELKIQDVARKLFNCFGNDVIIIFLNWYDQHPNAKHEKSCSEWTALISLDISHSISWLKSNENISKEIFLLFVTEINPSHKILKDQGSQLWINLLEKHKDSLTPIEEFRVANFFLPYSLLFPDETSHTLAAFSFPIINEELKQNKLSYSYWSRLDKILPDVSWFSYWDKCERLKKGMEKAGYYLP